FIELLRPVRLKREPPLLDRPHRVHADARQLGQLLLTTVPDTASPESEHGRGLLLVTALADKWGAGERNPGKIVWCEFERTFTPP
ncbi:MAG: ATP-binding protein, partial [Streptomyces sp.]|nr:ATP-binding protein [Streptomyces sp.]